MSASPELILAAQSGEKGAMEELVKTNMGLVKSVALRFRDRSCEFEDLCQIGVIGMIKAVRGFDFSHRTMFSTYAVPLICGEIKKFLRDDGMIKVSRELKQRGAILLRTAQTLSASLGREPTLSELAAESGMTPEEVAEGLEASCPVLSFSDPVGEMQLEDLLGTDHIDELTESIALRQAVATLPEDDRMLIRLRFFEGLSQSAAGQKLGMTQVKVSRREKKILAVLRRALEG